MPYPTLFLKLDGALEGFLGKFGISSNKTYTINTAGGSINRRSRSQVIGALDSLGGFPKDLTVVYSEPLGPLKGNRQVCLITTTLENNMVGCYLSVNGDYEDETNGLFETLRNRMDAEIKRQATDTQANTNVNANATSNSHAPSATPDPNLISEKNHANVVNNSWLSRIWRDHLSLLVTTIIATVAGGLILYWLVGRS